MRHWQALSVVVAGLSEAGAAGIAHAQEPSPENAAASFWTIAFSGLEAGNHSTFSSSGGKLVMSLGAGEPTAFIQFTTGSSVSDTIRANRGKMALGEVAMQGRLSFGLERGSGPWFFSGGFGPSAARLARKGGGSVIRAGAVVHGDLWFRPDNATYWTAGLIADSAERSLWSRLRYGLKAEALPLSFGPELTGSLSSTSRKLRAGLHISEIPVFRLNLDLAGGAQWDRHGLAPYVTLSAWMKY